MCVCVCVCAQVILCIPSSNIHTHTHTHTHRHQSFLLPTDQETKHNDVISMRHRGEVMWAGLGWSSKVTNKDHHTGEAPSGRGGGEAVGCGGGALTHTGKEGGGACLPCREMNELAREPRSLYPSQRRTEERKDMERKKRGSVKILRKAWRAHTQSHSHTHPTTNTHTHTHTHTHSGHESIAVFPERQVKIGM